MRYPGNNIHSLVMSFTVPFRPTYFYEEHLENHEEIQAAYHDTCKQLIAENILVDLERDKPKDELLENDKDFKSGNYQTTIFTDYFGTREQQQQRNATWSKFVSKYFINMIKMFAEQYKTESLVFTDIWTQQSKEFQSHSVHNHGPLGWSFVYYVDVIPEQHKPTVFLDPLYNIRNDSAPDYTPAMTNGLLVCFPSYILHYQPGSSSKNKRCIISGNFHA